MSGGISQQQSLRERAINRAINSDAPQTPFGSLEHCTRVPENDLSPSQSRSEVLSSAAVNPGRSVEPNFASRRNGMITFLGIDSARGSRRSNLTPITATHQPFQSADKDCRLSRSDSHCLQDIHDGVNTPSKTSTPIGKWHCCECQRGHGVYRFNEGQHLISILNCMCPHRSCKNCTFEGKIRRFAPMYDVEGTASVPIAGDSGEAMQFGVVCRDCGLSWQAEKVEVPKRHRSFRQRLSILPKKVNPLPNLRHARSMIHLGLPRDPRANDLRPSTAIPTSRSFLNLRSVSDSQAREPKPKNLVQGIQVRFYGIACTCGSVTDERSVCFVVVDMPKVESNIVGGNQTGREVACSAEPQYLPKLRAKGHGTPTLYLKGGSHPNPLMSNAVQG